MSKGTSITLEEVIKLYRFAGISPEQFFTEARSHREAVVAADQRMVIRCFGDDLVGFVHCRAYTGEAVRSLAAIMRQADAPPRARIQAIAMLRMKWA